jgi:hypothetical protein
MKIILNRAFLLLLIAITILPGCKKKETTDNSTPTTVEPQLIFKFKFDSTQARLNNIGQPASMPAGHSGQSPHFNAMSAHYIELAPNALTALGSGKVLYRAPETSVGGSPAIDFDQSIRVGEGQTFFSMPLKNVTPGTYQWLRISLAYQSYDVNYRVTVSGTPYDLTGTIASFIGFDTYIDNYKIKDSTMHVGANKLQGFWGFETTAFSTTTVSQGQAPPGATTVPNPINSTSPIPAGSCVVTGPFTSALSITGNETQNIVITVSLSTNKSFEWTDANLNGLYEPLNGDTVVDMGIRGLIPSVQY